ncbi:hypothetical protein ACTXT7_016557 [Hymenolepis weldensis]
MDVEQTERANKFKKNTFMGINTYAMLCGLGWIILGAIVLWVANGDVAFAVEFILLGILYIALTIGGFLVVVKNRKIYYRVYSGSLIILFAWEIVSKVKRNTATQ